MLLSWLIPPTGYVLGIWLLPRNIGGKLDLRRQSHIHRFIVASLLVPASVAAVNVLNWQIPVALLFVARWAIQASSVTLVTLM